MKELECTGPADGQRCGACLATEEHGHAALGRAPNCRDCPVCGGRAYGSSEQCYGWGAFYCAKCRRHYGRANTVLTGVGPGWCGGTRQVVSEALDWRPRGSGEAEVLFGGHSTMARSGKLLGIAGSWYATHVPGHLQLLGPVQRARLRLGGHPSIDAAPSRSAPPTHVISIRPRWMGAILSGAKTVELRKSRTNIPAGSVLALYETSPTKAIVGTARVSLVKEGPVQDLWADVGRASWVPRAEFFGYYQSRHPAHPPQWAVEVERLRGVALHLGDVIRLSEPITLDEMRGARPQGWRPPQSWMGASSWLQGLVGGRDGWAVFPSWAPDGRSGDE